MALSLVGATSTALAATGTSVTVNVPAGTADGDLLLVQLSGVGATAPTTPSGWSIWQTGTTTNANIGVFYRVAASEPASYTFTVGSNRWVGTMVALRGADTTTPKDITVPAATAGTTAVGFPAVTPVTAEAWVLAFATATFASGVTGNALTSSNLTVDASNFTNVAASVNASGTVGHFAWSSGAFTPAMSSVAALTRTLGISSVVRPSAAVAVPPRPIRTVNTAALVRASVF